MTQTNLPAGITIGTSRDGRAITWPTAHGSPHMMVVGSTGSGATTFLRYLAEETHSRHEVVHVLDPKRTDFIGAPGVEAIASHPTDWSSALMRVHDLMLTRLLQLGTGAAATFSPVTLLMSSFDEVLTRLDGGDRHKLEDLLRAGRVANIRCVLGASTLTKDVWAAQTRCNIGTWVAFEPSSHPFANLIWGAKVAAGAPWDLGIAVVAGGGDSPVEVAVPTRGEVVQR